jgi:hypothetical protein
MTVHHQNSSPSTIESIHHNSSQVTTAPRKTYIHYETSRARPNQAPVILFRPLPAQGLVHAGPSICSKWDSAWTNFSCWHRLKAKYHASSSRPAHCNDEIRCECQLLCPLVTRVPICNALLLLLPLGWPPWGEHLHEVPFKLHNDGQGGEPIIG